MPGARIADEGRIDRFASAAGAAVQEVTPLRHNGYKVPLTKALLRTALTALTDPHAH